MATTGALSSLSEDDIVVVHEALYKIRAKYEFVGLRIGVKKPDIDAIEKEHREAGKCLLEILAVRLKQTPLLTWKDILDALRSEVVGEPRLANEIENKIIERCKGTSELENSMLTNQGSECEKDGRASHENKKEGGAAVQKIGAPVLKSSSSESDGSPPSPVSVISINLTEIEKKQLKKTFKCQFGRMCCLIKDPVEVASLLQAKRLISLSTMTHMLKSPESCQDKTICLVCELQKKVKQHPQRILTIIDVFLNCKATEEAGKELCTATGKVLPENACKLHSKQQHFTPSSVAELTLTEKQQESVIDQFSIDGERFASKNIPDMAEKVNPLTPAVMPIIKISSISSHSEVSQSSSLPRLSPLLSEYSTYLKSCYRARSLAVADKFLPTLNVPYINLATVNREDIAQKERDKFTRDGGVDQVLGCKTPIAMEDLLSPEKKDGEPVRFVLVEGPPGIGKSTFVWEICRRWDKILGDYQIVVMLRLRENWVLNAKSLSDLFRYPFQPELSHKIAQELHNCCGRNLLLILDGFDEISHSFHEDSVIKSILCRELLPECTIILTARPSAKAILDSVCQPRVDKHVEIIGFTEEERVRFITEVFSMEPELQANFLKYMLLIPHIKSMMYIPLHCAILARVYYESQKDCCLALPKTRTQLFKALTHSILVRHNKTTRNKDYACTLPEGLEAEDKKMFRQLAELAYNGCYCTERKLTFFGEDIPEGFVHFGLMNESSEMYIEKGVKKTFSFLHLSLQEYLAAWHISNMDVETQGGFTVVAVLAKTIKPVIGDTEQCRELEAYMQEILDAPVEPAIFLAGITGWKSQDSEWETYLSSGDNLFVHSLVLIRSMYEAQNPTLPSQYFAVESRRHVTINQELTPYDCYALSYCVVHSTVPLSLGLELKSNVDDLIALVEIFVKGINNYSESDFKPNIQHLVIKTSGCSSEISDKCLYWLTELNNLGTIQQMLFIGEVNPCRLSTFLKSMVNVQSLIVFMDPASLEWLEALTSLKQLQALKIHYPCDMNPQSANLTCWPEVSGLKVLNLNVTLPLSKAYYYGTQSPTDSLNNSILKSVLRSNQITKLFLPYISRETMSSIKHTLLCCSNLVSMELVRTRLGYDGILFICYTLKMNTMLKYLLINDVDLPFSGDKQPTIGTFTSMEEIPLPERNTTCTDFLLQLNNILQSNKTLNEITIQTGLFLPLLPYEAGLGTYFKWTGQGCFEQYNLGAVASGRSSNLRRSFSSSDLTRQRKVQFWTKVESQAAKVDFEKIFSKRKKVKRLCSLPSFTAPETQVLRSFSGLDHRLKKCLRITSDFLHLHAVKLRGPTV